VLATIITPIDQAEAFVAVTVDASLHHPRCRRVAQSMGRDISSKLGKPDCGLEGGFDRLHALAVPLEKVLMHDALGDPNSPELSEQGQRSISAIGTKRTSKG